MGLFRKAVSVSTLGAVKYTSRREAQTKQALAEAKYARAQEKLTRAETRAAREAVRAREAAPAQPDPALPWYRQPTLGKAIHALHRNRTEMHDR
jgi:hypothetical protein